MTNCRKVAMVRFFVGVSCFYSCLVQGMDNRMDRGMAWTEAVLMNVKLARILYKS